MGKAGMTRLVDAIQELGLRTETNLGGRWAKLHGERASFYVAETAWGGGFLTWCDAPCSRVVEFYPDPVQAIQSGLRRSAQPDDARAERRPAG